MIALMIAEPRTELDVSTSNRPQPMKTRGRPRSFVTENVLDRALRLFWHKGFEGATLDALSDAMGINRPSIYGAFGNKESLFIIAVTELQRRQLKTIKSSMMASSSALEAVDQVLLLTIEALCSGNLPPLCPVMLASLVNAPEEVIHSKQMIRLRREHREVIAQQLHEHEYGLRGPVEVETIVSHCEALIAGISLQARCGAGRSEMDSIRISFLAMRN